MQGPESRFRNSQVVPFLRTLKNCYYMSVSQTSLRGDPDLIVCINGYFIGLELKAENGRLSKLQSFKLAQINKSGGLGFEVRRSNWDGIKEKLLKLSNGA